MNNGTEVVESTSSTKSIATDIKPTSPDNNSRTEEASPVPPRLGPAYAPANSTASTQPPQARKRPSSPAPVALFNAASNTTINTPLPPPSFLATAYLTGSSSGKRRRTALSCHDCRRRKLQCDRAYPACSRCVKGGYAGSCTYDTSVATAGGGGGHEEGEVKDDPVVQEVERLFANPRASLPVRSEVVAQRGGEGDLGAKVEAQGRRIRVLEERLARVEGVLLVDREGGTGGRVAGNLVQGLTAGFAAPVVIGGGSAAGAVVVRPRVLCSKGFQGEYFGPSHAVGLLHEFPQLSGFFERLRGEAVFMRAHKELRAVAKMRKLQPDAFGDVAKDLLDALPAREIVEQNVRLYLSTFDAAYHVIHVPSFWREWAKFWTAPKLGRPAFMAIMLLMSVTVACMQRERDPKFVGYLSLACVAAQGHIRIVERWVEGQSQKHTTLEYFQVRCILLLAKRINGIKEKRQWIEARELLNFALGTGFHCEHAGRTSVFEREMKRRLWAAIVELDLLASLDRGVPPAFDSIWWDCAAPRNIRDVELETDSKLLPDSQDTEYTSSWFLNVSRGSLPLRLEVASVVNKSSTTSYEAVLQYHDRISESLAKLDELHGSVTTKSGQPRGRMLRSQLNTLLMLLHRSVAAKTSHASQAKFSRMIVTDCAMDILEGCYSSFLGGQTAQLLLTRDVAHALFTICFTTVVLDKSARTAQQAEAILNQALEMLEEKATLAGTDARNRMLSLKAVALVKGQARPEQAQIFEQRAIDSMTSSMYKLLSSQIDHPNAATPLAGLAAEQSGAQRSEWRQTMLAPSPTNMGSQRYGPLFETPGIGDTSNFSWDLDDLWDF